ncbi:MAG: PQQ-binding-like beta-propeller repeat protein, partial [Planctomycetota bacterium]|nr:PQQ-binding-like beta-propeller repeat protein [Planctomycetota bacterium]
MNRHALVIVLLTICTCMFAAAPHAYGENWPEFRGPTADGHSTATNLPLKWSEQENIRWKIPIPGKAWSSPVVWDNLIWLTTALEDGTEMRVMAIDLQSGKVVHDIQLWEIKDPQYAHATNSHASSTPAIEAGRLYAHFGSNGTAAVDTRTGAVLWKRLDLECDHHRGAASSPIIFENLLILTFDGFDVQFLIALNKETGETVWKVDRNIHPATLDGDYKKAYGTPRILKIGEELQLISPSAGATVAYDPRTGKELWRVLSGGMNAAARPLFGNGMIYATTAAGGWQLFAMRPGGHGDISKSHVEWKYAKAVPTRSSPLLNDDRIYMVNDTGIISCVNAKTGKSVWVERVGGNFSSSPIYADGKIYFFNETGTALVLKPADNYELLATNELSEGMMASPVAVDGSL